MKLELLIEDGRPVIVFPQQITSTKMLEAYNTQDGHVYISRGYMRGLKKPETAEEIRRCWQLLVFYAGSPG